MDRTQKSRHPAIVAFVHTYQQDGTFDPYMTSVIKAFSEAGLSVHVIRTNDLVPHLGANRYKKTVSEDKLLDTIREIDPVFLFTTNRGGITEGIMTRTSCPIVTRMVDLVPFYHHGGGDDSLFCERDYVFVPTRDSVDAFETKYPAVKGRVIYLPFATNPHEFEDLEPCTKDINVSFVGTYFYCDQLTHIFNGMHDDDAERQAMMALIDDIGQDFHVDLPSRNYAATINHVCARHHMSLEDMRMLISNVYALNRRVHYLDAISDCGLQLYGTPNWTQVNQFSLKLLRCYQFGEKIFKRRSLLELYQRSRIALNVSHHQAGAGMPYRVFDIMASSALLVTDHHPDSEMFDLFGADMPVPMYRNAQELRTKVRHYIDHDDERNALVARCNALIVEKELTFKDRARVYCQVAGCNHPAGKYGAIIMVSPTSFTHFAIGENYAAGAPVRKKSTRLGNPVRRVLRWIVPYRFWVSIAPADCEPFLHGEQANTQTPGVERRNRYQSVKSLMRYLVPFRIWLWLHDLRRIRD